ncbi:heme oxygenase [Corynebacterium phocae]|uniref:Heme oxygenase n=1 Tax=Corynebacterium phocae TaxID=161895 RepID=A0A1L7D0N2_9CORY|nr:biliverdin-producing heme oxygenase [Corynebacterium phocae]APT91623.1 heme oxygenase [Corynebacterium phocae]KAA8720701.1 biliverdin-producing heme oxygenase [Corynebacterium phocae]
MTIATGTQPLSVALREETSKAHEATEGSDFMTRLIGGQLDDKAVAMYTGQLWFVYDALERAVRSFVGSPIVDAFADPRLERRDSLESDLQEMLGDDWRDQIKILPATAKYVGHLETLKTPEAAVAHHYVRYLGDVSGGQVISARLQKAYGFGPEKVKFYDFSSVGKPVPFRRSYREALDNLELTAEQRANLIAEAGTAFYLNLGVFVELKEAIAK